MIYRAEMCAYDLPPVSMIVLQCDAFLLILASKPEKLDFHFTTFSKITHYVPQQFPLDALRCFFLAD